jgi:K+-transporting ATPase ATPase C chain
MHKHLCANLWLLLLSFALCSVVYPAILWGIGQALFPEGANGSIILDKQGKPVGSRLIGQPFTKDEYFQPRPSAAAYNGAASAASNWGASNYLLRNRVARQLGPLVRYRSGAKARQPAGPDIEGWLQKDRFQGKPGIVAQWAQAHPGLAQGWVKAEAMNGEFVNAWRKEHPDDVARWIEDNPDHPEPKPEDLAALFFTSYSRAHPGTFPGAVERQTAGGKTEKRIEPVKEGTDIQRIFFDLWRQDHPEADLEPVPADMVMASGSGLDPHITLKSALYQLSRVAGAWSEKRTKDGAQIEKEIGQMLEEKAAAPLGGLAGVQLINVLEINLALRERYESLEERK